MGKSIKELVLEADKSVTKDCTCICNKCKFNKKIKDDYTICNVLKLLSLRYFNK